MATSSQVKTALDDIAGIISIQRAVLEKAIQNASAASAVLAAIPTTYVDVIATINAFGTTDAFENLAKAEKAKLQAEFTALKADADAIAATNLNN